MHRRRLLYVLIVGLLLSALLWLADAWRFRSELALLRREVTSGHYGTARRHLASLPSRWQARGDVQFLLGVCEKALGNTDAALKAWARVSPGSPDADQAVMMRARAVLKNHRFAVAEDLLAPMARTRGPFAVEASVTLAHILKVQGRLTEVIPLLQRSWAEAGYPVATLQELWRLDHGEVSIEELRGTLETAQRAAPDDDRVWLGLGRLAILTGRYGEAAAWLSAVEKRRPDDPVVWRARLDLAIATDDLEAAEFALRHLREGLLRPDELLSIRAWLAARGGDREGERMTLMELLRRDPADMRSMDKLANLALLAGEPEQAAQLRRRKAELDGTISRYRQLLFRDDPLAHAKELAQLAESLQRRFDAKAWWTLSARRDPHDADTLKALARLEHAQTRPDPKGPSLVDLLTDFSRNSVSHPARASSGARTVVPIFADDAESAGLRFSYDSGRSSAHQLPETMGGGVGLLDYDGDGWLDVYVVQGGPFPPPASPSHCADRLWHNMGDGRFLDVTEASKLAEMPGGYGLGVAVGDYDNDGNPDLFITRWRSYALYRNLGNGTFQDVTDSAGLGGPRDWPTSAAFADLDGDGDLDLYVCHYLEWDPDHPWSNSSSGGQAATQYNPLGFPALADHVFRNDGGRFTDVTAESGIVDRNGRGLGVAAADFDGDGKVDLFVANDMSANYLFRNQGEFRFEEVAEASGVSSSAEGGYLSGMGVGVGDLDGDGLVDIAVTNFYAEATTFYHNLGSCLFADRTKAIGLAVPSRQRLGFGIVLFDANNDGYLDMATANGHVEDMRPSIPYAMPAQLLIGNAKGRLSDVTDAAGPAWQVSRLGRALAVGDLDNDGRLDLVLIAHDIPLAFLHNKTPGGHFLVVQLVGTKSVRDAVGAVVTIKACQRRWVAQRIGGGSYQSASDGRLHFGLGECEKVELVRVAWPSGKVDEYRGLAADRGYGLREGDPEPRPIRAYSRK